MQAACKPDSGPNRPIEVHRSARSPIPICKLKDMIRLTLVSFAAAILATGAANPVEAQTPPAEQSRQAIASRFDASIYIGGSWSTPWLEAKTYDFGIGYNPAGGASLTGWMSPHLGLRVHGAFIPARIPTAAGLDSLQRMSREGRPLNIWFYDLDVVGRPFVTRPNTSWRLSSVYLWLGLGGLTVDPAGAGSAEEMGCLFPYYLGDACLSYDGGKGTVGQITAGAGMDLFYVRDNISVFGELGVHVYDSPFHMGPGWTRRPLDPVCRCVAEDLTALTTRLVLGTRISPRRAATVLAVAPPAAPPPALPPPPPLPAPEQPIQVCAVVEGVPRYVEAMLAPQSGDTVVATGGVRRPLRAVYPAKAETAAGQSWFVNGEDIFLEGRPYVKFGVPRAIEASELSRIGRYDGMPVFQLRNAEDTTPAKAVYLPVQDGCLFQPYQVEQLVRGVRG
jgi:hypothetical protein